jgi:hypothetical protein
MRSRRFTRAGHAETATQGNRRFVILPTQAGKLLAKVYDKEGRRQDFVASNVCESRDDAVAWLKKHRIERRAS